MCRYVFFVFMDTARRIRLRFAVLLDQYLIDNLGNSGIDLTLHGGDFGISVSIPSVYRKEEQGTAKAVVRSTSTKIHKSLCYHVALLL